MKLYCAALEHHDGRLIPATSIGNQGDMLFLMCDECTDFYRDDYPIDPVLAIPPEVQVQGSKGGRKPWWGVIPGDVVLGSPEPNGEGMSEMDGPEDRPLYQVDTVRMESDGYVHVEFAGFDQPWDSVDGRFRATKEAEVIGHRSGYGLEREDV